MQSVRFRNSAVNQEKAERTKALLMDAAMSVFAERGIEAAPISAITNLARVANGTFYYHWKDKAEFVDHVGHAVAASIVNQVDQAMVAISNGAKRVAIGTQLFIRIAAAEPTWGRMIVHALRDMGEFRASISRGRARWKLGLRGWGESLAWPRHERRRNHRAD